MKLFKFTKPWKVDRKQTKGKDVITDTFNYKIGDVVSLTEAVFKKAVAAKVGKLHEKDAKS